MTKPTRTNDRDHPVLTGAALVTLQRWVDGLQPFYQSVRRAPESDAPTERAVPLRRPLVRPRRLHPGQKSAER